MSQPNNDRLISKTLNSNWFSFHL